MTEQLPGMEFEWRDRSRSQWFTPPDTALQIVQWALAPFDPTYVATMFNVLEPSAGRGALARPLRERARFVHCVDVDPRNAVALERDGFAVDCCDFLDWSSWQAFDLAVLNPPFENGQAEAHILKALKVAKRVVAHCPLTTLEGRKRREGLWSEAYLKRLAICSSRPKYGEKAGATAMCTIDVVRRPEKPHGRVAASGVEVEWWP